MKKSAILLSGLVLCISNFAHADNWYAGLTLGHSFADNTGKIGFNDGTDYTSEKKSFGGKQFFTGSLFAGRSIPFKEYGNVLVDVAYQYNNEKASASSITSHADAKATIERPLTFVLNVGFEKPVAPSVDVFFKVGAAISQFDTKLEDVGVGQTYSGRDSKNVFGFVPTLGIQKDISGINFGLSYSYYMYQDFTARKVNLAGAREYTSKVSPRYHVLEARISKKF